MRRRAIGVSVAAVVAVGIVVAGGVALAVSPSAPPPAASSAPPEKTATVERGDLAITSEVQGQVAFGAARQITARKEGTITWLPEVGATIKRGEALLRVDDRAVSLFLGDTPMYRTLDGSGLSGPDVDVVAANLIELGYLEVFPEGDVTGPLFAGAVARWREATGLPAVERPSDDESDPGASPEDADTDADTDSPKDAEEGADDGEGADAGAQEKKEGDPAKPRTTMTAIEPADVIVSSSDVRVAGVRAQLGDASLDTVVLDVTSTRKTVTLDAAAAQKAPVAVGATVTVILPGGEETTGTVQSVGAAGATGGDDPTEAPAVVIDIADQAALEGVDGGPVSVRVVSESREGVLTVPVSALLALREGGYALQRADGSLVPVTTGLFTDQRVEVSGEDVTEGLVVVDAT